MARKGLSKKDVYAIYRDDGGEPRLVESRLLFFDVLGTTEMSKSPSAEAELRRFRPVLDRAVNRAMTEDTAMYQASTWFTDNVVVAAPLVLPHLSEAVIGMAEVSAAYLQVMLWEEGFLGRGAITFGPHYMDKRFVFGPALIEAVEIEKATKWPRVELGSRALAMEREHSQFYGSALSSTQSSCLLRDQAGAVFVDCLGVIIDDEDDPEVLDHHLRRLRDITIRQLDTLPPDDKPWKKWRWIADYQNHALRSRLGDPGPYLVPEQDEPFTFASFNDPRFDTPPGSAWYFMDRAPFSLIGYHLDDPPVADEPGVYALYDTDGHRLFIQSARNVYSRARTDLGRTPATARKSALCQRLAEHTGIAPADAIADGTYTLTAEDYQRLRGRLSDLRMGAAESMSLSAARAFERELLAEFVPPLNQ